MIINIFSNNLALCDSHQTHPFRERPYVIDGDLICNEDTNIKLDKPLIIKGDVCINGSLYTEQSIYILGNMNVNNHLASHRDIYCKGHMYVNGNITAKDLIISAGGVIVNGNIFARCEVALRSFVRVKGSILTAYIHITRGLDDIQMDKWYATDCCITVPCDDPCWDKFFLPPLQELS